MEEYKAMCPLFEADLLECLKPENCVAARTSYGGPAPQNNAEQVKLGKETVEKQKKKLEELKERI